MPLPEAVYTQRISCKTLPYVVDHPVGDCMILPGAVYLEAALAAGKELLGPTCSAVTVPLTVENLSIEAAMEVVPKKSVQLQTVVACGNGNGSRNEPLQYSIAFHRLLMADQCDNWKRLATATFLPVASACGDGGEEQSLYKRYLPVEEAKSRLEQRENIGGVYQQLKDRGIEYGPVFQCIVAAWTSSTEVLTEIRLGGSTQDRPLEGSEPIVVEAIALVREGFLDCSGYICHPAIIDAMFQTSAFSMALNGTKDDQWLRLPLSVRRFTWMGHAPETPTLYVHSVTAGTGSEDGGGTVFLYSETGSLLAVLEGLELIKVSIDSFIREIGRASCRERV